MQERVWSLFHEIISDVQKTQSEVIEHAADSIFQRVVDGGAVHVFDTGHLVDREIIHRAGGLALWRPLRWDLQMTNPVRKREGVECSPDNAGLISHVLRCSRVKCGDVLIAGSVSGRSETVIELVLRAREYGVLVIALTSPEYSRRLTSQHSSGARLFEVADIVIDNRAPYGDAALSFDGLDEKLIPVSGIAAVSAMWALTAGVAERLLHSGRTPSLYASVNRPDTRDLNRSAEEGYRRHGW